MITSLASVTSTASLTSKNQKLLAGWLPCNQEPQHTQWPQQTQWPQWPHWPQQPHFIKTLTKYDVAINLATKLPIVVSQWGMDHQKSTILWMSGTFSVRGCGLDTILSLFCFFFGESYSSTIFFEIYWPLGCMYNSAVSALVHFLITQYHYSP